MLVRTYQVKFHTPCFLGDARHDGVWRTPPFKALLRHWWRIVHVAEHRGIRVDDLRSTEARLFGSVATEACRSQVRLRLDHWKVGELRRVPVSTVAATTSGTGAVNHRQGVDPLTYLGYGRLSRVRSDNVVGIRADQPRVALAPDQQAELRFAWPDDLDASMRAALALADRFGTMGGRSRNGWGSIGLTATGSTPALDTPVIDHPLLIDWTEALRDDWPTGIGCDDKGPLIWTWTPASRSPGNGMAARPGEWHEAMRILATVRREVRRLFPHGWRRANVRIPNALAFKVWRRPGDLQYVATITHFPWLPPTQFLSAARLDRGAVRDTWQRVHAYLDAHSELGRERRPV